MSADHSNSLPPTREKLGPQQQKTEEQKSCPLPGASEEQTSCIVCGRGDCVNSSTDGQSSLPCSSATAAPASLAKHGTSPSDLPPSSAPLQQFTSELANFQKEKAARIAALEQGLPGNRREDLLPDGGPAEGEKGLLKGKRATAVVIDDLVKWEKGQRTERQGVSGQQSRHTSTLAEELLIAAALRPSPEMVAAVAKGFENTGEVLFCVALVQEQSGLRVDVRVVTGPELRAEGFEGALLHSNRGGELEND